VNSKANSRSSLDTLGEDLPAVLLVGGMGTRLQSILPSMPKALAPVGKVPFLQLLVLQLRSQGIRRVVMCTGHRADQIEEEFGDGHKWDLAIEYSKESGPLGTAGALKFAERYLLKARDFLVMNGDSFLEFDFLELLRFHRERGALMSMAVRGVPDAARYGTVQVDTRNRVAGFCEKSGSHVAGLVNGGVYLFHRTILEHLSERPSSLEQDVFPLLLARGIFALEQHGMFIDIGTPEDYARAQALYETLYQTAVSESQSGPGNSGPR
jgi:D-glycero-alpha-D-manno-heptose 1-phosphate guanylyltransferase